MDTSSLMPVDAANTEQLRAWDGDEGSYWAAHAEAFDRSLASHHERLLDVARIGAHERVLDIGCGTGQTTRDAARAASGGSALGVDLSAAMLEYARRRASDEGLTNAEFVQADAQIHRFPSRAFDIVISRTGTMFFGDQAAAFANLASALVPSGRLVMITWQGFADNEWIREISSALSAGVDRPAPPPDAPGPFSLSDPERVHSMLGSAGFRDIALEDLHAPMWLGAETNDAHQFVIGLLHWMLDGVDEAGRARALDDLRSMLSEHATQDGVVLESAAWVITAHRA